MILILKLLYHSKEIKMKLKKKENKENKLLNKLRKKEERIKLI